MSERTLLAAKRKNLELRSRLLHEVRSFFLREGFTEVQTPVLTAAPAPEPHIDAVRAEGGFFLGTSPELYMKRLLAAGYPKIFQMGPVFRSGERGRRHLPEFTMIEWYRLGHDYTSLQADCQNLLRHVASACGVASGLARNGLDLDVAGEWRKVTVKEAFMEHAGWAPEDPVDQDRFDEDMAWKVEPHLGYPAPCILTDYPASQAALARLKPGAPSEAERFELYWAGIELANGFSELVDPVEQRLRFEATREERRRAGRVVYPMPEAFLEALETLPPSAGIALGIDRLTMLLTGAATIDDVVAFPEP